MNQKYQKSEERVLVLRAPGMVQSLQFTDVLGGVHTYPGLPKQNALARLTFDGAGLGVGNITAVDVIWVTDDELGTWTPVQ